MKFNLFLAHWMYPQKLFREMEIRMTGTNVSFDGNYDEDSEENSFAPSAYLGDRRFNPEDNYEANWDENPVVTSRLRMLLKYWMSAAGTSLSNAGSVKKN